MRQQLFNRTCLATALGLALAHTAFAAPATGGPGNPSVWANSIKSMVGTSATDTSKVYFTGHRGIISEVFWPQVDTVNTVDMQFLIGDVTKTFVDEEKQQAYSVTRPDSKALLFQAVTNNTGHNWKITKKVFTDPARDVLIQRITFEGLNGKLAKDFNLYVLHNPSMDNSGAGDTSKTLAAGGRTMLVASQNTKASALAISAPWKLSGATPMVSSGFVGVNDGFTDLLGGAADKTMNNLFDSATSGNVSQIGLIDLGSSATATSVSFDMVLGFGTTEANAMNAANAALAAGNTTTAETTYKTDWNTYANGLSTQGGTADAQYYAAAMSLKASQDKTNGAIVAGMGTPWGESFNDLRNDGRIAAGYHLVWARDLFKFANALVTAGDTTTANKTVNYLFNVQMQTTDCGASEYMAPNCPQGYSRQGRFPQNSWVDGRQYWEGTQMDEAAMPIILAERLGRNDLWPKIKMAADFIAATGPTTYQERWEEVKGYSPSTIAAEVAGLVAAAKIARANNDAVKAKIYLAKADDWQRRVADWTFTTNGTLGNGSFGNGRYYVRATADGQPNSTTGTIKMGNIPPAIENQNPRNVIDGGFLELVRMGVKDANDAGILDTLPEYDGVLKQTIAGKGPAWFRYNIDGYGESPTGGNYFDGSLGGRGRLWPIFTAERGMYEIAKAGNVGTAGSSYLTSVRAFSTAEGFVPEQVWNNSANIATGTGLVWDTPTPAPYVPGSPTKSMAPLSWAMGEYINLMASIAQNKIADVPVVVCARYANCTAPLAAGQSSVKFNASANTNPGENVYIVGLNPELGAWDTGLAIPANPRAYPVWSNSLNLAAGTAVQYKYVRRNTNGTFTYENLVGNRTFTMPAAGATVTRTDTVIW
jgi:glucoamylase